MEANFDEARQSQLAAVELLINMGYTYLPCSEVQRLRAGDEGKFILREMAFEFLSKINAFEYKGQQHKFNDKNVYDAIDELENVQLEGLQDTAKKVYHMIMTNGGKTLREMVDGRISSHNFRFVDFAHPENNAFHVAVEFPVKGKQEDIRPDIVCFVNGIPFAIIENKKSGTDVKEALDQMNRNQRPERAPKLFIYPQLLIATNTEQCLYGTTGTPNKFYAAWKEKDIDPKVLDTEIQKLIQTPVTRETYVQLCHDLNGETINHIQLTDRLTTEQDRGLYGLLRPERLLSLSRHFVLFDAGTKKIARYPQFFALYRMLKRVEHELPGVNGNKREGGIVWHTQGSGKSLTMVLFVKALIESAHIDNPRIIVVTDRIDLDRQISETFRNCNLKKDVVQASTGKHLLTLIKEKNPAVITSLVHKFESASKTRAGFTDEDKNLFVLIDEAHRTQGGMANAEMRRAIPNACFIAFTGTPLLKKEKSNNQFGSFIDKYTIDDALTDGVILPLIYEGRFAEMTQNQEKVDRHTERITQGLNQTEVRELQKFINSKVLKSNPHRIGEIAYDIEDHFCSQFQGTGLKAQLVAPSKFSAIKFHEIFKASGRIKSAVIISETQVKDEETDDHKREVTDFLAKVAADYSGLESYEEKVINSFKDDPDGVEMLIVVDKLLTGFDAPRNTVLYLTKDLRDHNLLQAIARVNRLFDNTKRPKTAGFIIDYSQNAQNIKTAMDLFGSYDKEDVRRALIDTAQKIEELEDSYDALETLLKGVENKKDSESYIQYLADEQKRDQFYKEFRAFVKNLDECLSLHEFANKFRNLDMYKRELKRYAELRKSAQLKYADKKDLSEYKTQLVKILDEYVDAEKVEMLTGQININDKAAFDEALEDLGSHKSKAEAIAAQMQRTITEKAHADPEFYNQFSAKIEKILAEMRTGKLADVEALKRMKEMRDHMVEKKDESLPSKITAVPGADIFYRNLRHNFEKVGLSEDAFCQIILDIVAILKKEAIIDWQRQADTQRVMKSKIDDYLYDEVQKKRKVALDNETIRDILDRALALAIENSELFS